MTKEELGKKAIKALDKKCVKGCSKYYRYGFQDGYIAGAEPREKQIQIDAEHIIALQNQNGELTDENERLKGDLELWENGACRATNLDKCGVVKELEAQIEKMKCCKEEIIKALKETLDYEWLHAHNGKAKYLYLQTVIDIVNEKFKEIKENE